jgi:hypothetical protein
MPTKSTFQGKFMYYENINGKEKKVSKAFTDLKKFNDFAKKYPMPTLGSLLGLAAPVKKTLVAKKTAKKPVKKVVKKKK